ncbi:MAG: DUF1287 domain-containing protein [Armatimonadetes bacterium]|nr:DUF1287 domain-containing protein [Armatimonadota bacterium]
MIAVIALTLLLFIAGCQEEPRAKPPSPTANKVLISAKQQAEEGAIYDASYRQIPYPMGDVSEDRGACTDVVVRALRAAGKDLQALIHKDAKANPAAYHRIERGRLDKNIDHRRVPNHLAFLRRHAQAIKRDDLMPGDLVYWILDNGRDHCGIVSDAKNARGEWLVVHNLSRCQEEDVLTRWKFVAGFRYP